MAFDIRAMIKEENDSYFSNKETSVFYSIKINQFEVCDYRMAFALARTTRTETSKLKNLISASFEPLSLKLPIATGAILDFVEEISSLSLNGCFEHPRLVMLALVGAQEPFARSQTCLCAAMEIKSLTRPKVSLGLLPQEENDSYYSLIPGLPEDVAKVCLALVPRSDLPVMGDVSKRWRSFIQSKEFIAVRREAGKLEEWIYILTGNAEGKGCHWEVLGCFGNKQSVLPPMPGATKAGFGVVVLDGNLLVIAGYSIEHGKECVSDEVYQYDSRLNRWSILAKMNIARYDFACAEVNGAIYAVGGFGPDGDSLSSAEVYNADLNKWTLIESIRRPRWGCFACSFEGKLYVMGGRSAFTIGNSRFVNVYDPESHAWSENKNGCVMVTSHAVLGKKLFCMEWKNQRCLAIFNQADNSWQKIAVPLTGSTTTSFSLGIADGKLLLFSLNEEPGYQTLQYDPNAPVGSEWQTSSLKPSGACFCSVTIKA